MPVAFQRLCHAKREREALLGVEPGIVIGVVAVLQHDVDDRLSTLCQFGSALAQLFFMDTAYSRAARRSIDTNSSLSLGRWPMSSDRLGGGRRRRRPS